MAPKGRVSLVTSAADLVYRVSAVHGFAGEYDGDTAFLELLCQVATGQVGGAEAIDVWVAANQPAYMEETAVRTRLVRALVARRVASGLSQVEVGRRMGTTQSAVSEFERGLHYPQVETLQRYARAVGGRLRVSLEWLDEPQTPKQ